MQECKQMKRILFVVCFILASLPILAVGDDYGYVDKTIGEFTYRVHYNAQIHWWEGRYVDVWVELIKVETQQEEITIPETFIFSNTEYSVRLGYGCFSGCQSVVKVNGSTTYNIPNYCFSDCINLQEVNFSVGEIGNYAFSGCSSFKQIPSTATSIGEGAFTNCVGLPTEIAIPNSVKNIGRNAFEGCSILSLKLGENLEDLEECAFKGCNITSLSIPKSVINIRANAFGECSQLTTLKIEDGDTEICMEDAFSQSPIETFYLGRSVCGSFKNMSVSSVEIGAKAKSIGKSFFAYCLSLSSISIPNNIEVLGDGAFEGCNSLKSVELGNGLTSINSYLFHNCSSLTYICVPNDVNVIGSHAFDGCTNLSSISIGDNITFVGNNAFANCIALKALQLPIRVETIEARAFRNCKSIEVFTIPQGIESIGQETFEGCSELQEIVVPSSIVSIGVSAFKNCTKLSSFYIPSSTNSISGFAFSGCKSLKDIIIPNKVKKIENGTFSGCAALKTATIGYSVSAIGNDAFSGCRLMEVVSLNVNPPTLSSYCFSIIDGAKLKVRKGCKKAYQDAKFWNGIGFEIEEFDYVEDVPEKQAEALAKYNDGIGVYDCFMFYYKGDGQIFYLTTIGKQSDNNKVADDIFTDIERLRKQLSDSSMSDDEKASFNKSLDEIDNAVYALKKENESGYYINFNDRVQKYYEQFSDYNNRLAQYKERIDAASTDEELNAIIAEIEADAAGMKDYYLNPIIEDYNAMVIISERFTEIGEELSKYQLNLNSIAKEIEQTASGIEQVVISNGDAIAVNLRGERLIIKSTQIGALPKGIYIVNGRKYVVK